MAGTIAGLMTQCARRSSLLPQGKGGFGLLILSPKHAIILLFLLLVDLKRDIMRTGRLERVIPLMIKLIWLLVNVGVVYGEWSSTPEGTNASIPSLYFSDVKLTVWSSVAERMTEACRSVRSVVSRYFDTHQRDLISQLVGMIVDLR